MFFKKSVFVVTVIGCAGFSIANEAIDASDGNQNLLPASVIQPKNNKSPNSTSQDLLAKRAELSAELTRLEMTGKSTSIQAHTLRKQLDKLTSNLQKFLGTQYS